MANIFISKKTKYIYIAFISTESKIAVKRFFFCFNNLPLLLLLNKLQYSTVLMLFS